MTDGLLQRYLPTGKLSDHAVSRQGQMMSYWHGGNNYEFVFLLSSIEKVMGCRDLIEEQENDGDDSSDDENDATSREKRLLQKAKVIVRRGIDFADSFADDTADIWQLVSGPFQKATEEDVKDFLVDDGEISEEDIADSDCNSMNERDTHRALLAQDAKDEFDRFQRSSEKLAREFQLKSRESDDHGGNENDDDDDQSSILIVNEELSLGSKDDVRNGGKFVESSEDEDDWLKQRSLRPSKRRLKSPLNVGSSSDSDNIQVENSNVSFDEDEEIVVSSARKKNVVLFDDDDSD